MTRWPWRRKVEQANEAVRQAEQLRDRAQLQQRQAEEIAPRVDAIATSLRRMRVDARVGRIVDAAIRGGGG